MDRISKSGFVAFAGCLMLTACNSPAPTNEDPNATAAATNQAAREAAREMHNEM